MPISAKVAASDPNGDAITLTLMAGPAWLSMATDGRLSGTPSEADIGQHEIDLEASDGTETARATIPLVVDFDAVEMALRIGDYTIIEEETDQTPAELLKAVVSEIEQQNNADIIELLGLNAAGELTDQSFDNINWGLHPVDTSRLTPTFGRSAPFLRAIGRLGARDIPQTVSVLGRHLSGRFMVFGNNPLSGTFDDTDDRHLLMKRSLYWLSDTVPGRELNIMIAHVKGDRENDQSRMKDWLDGAFGTDVDYNQDGACNGLRFQACLADSPDLMIIYQNVNTDLEADTLLGMIEEALANGIGILHVHRQTQGHRTAFGGRLLNLFGVTENGSVVHSARVSGAQPLGDLLNWRPGFVQSAMRLIDGITDQSYAYDLSVCSGPIQCNENTAFHTEAYRDIANLQNFLLDMARRDVTPFPANDTNRFIGALLLAGDYFRSQTAYPMPKQTTPSSEIVRALFGGVANLITRDFVPAAPDMGRYSRSDFDDSAKGDHTVSVPSRNPFTTTGVYALPGETVTVTRRDGSPQTVRLQIQSIPSAANQPFFTVDGINHTQPAFLNSTQIALEPRGTVQFTSPYGGPIHLYSGSNTDIYELAFENVGRHPVWRGPQDTDAFLIDLAANVYNWAELVAANFQVHATLDQMRVILNTPPYTNAPSTLAAHADAYLHDWPRWLIGQQGPGIRENADLRSYVDGRVYSYESWGEGRHYYSDGVACSEVCRGNPYQAARPFNPIGDADLTLMAETIAEGHHQILTIAHSLYRYRTDTNAPTSNCPALPHRTLYEQIRAGQMSEDKLQTDDAKAALIIQLAAALENQNIFGDGWILLPRLNTNERIFREAAPNYWGTSGAPIGYHGLLKTEANQLSLSDRWLIDLSWSAQRDLTPYLEMWGLTPSDRVREIVANYGFDPIQPLYYALDDTGHCEGLDHPARDPARGDAW